MKKDEIEYFIKIQSQMEELYNEVSILSRKSQNDALNEFKLLLVNTLLEKANELLNEKYRPFKDFNIFDKDKIPTNSDVVMVLSQYLACLENMKIDNTQYSLKNCYWIIDGKVSNLKTNIPNKLL